METKNINRNLIVLAGLFIAGAVQAGGTPATKEPVSGQSRPLKGPALTTRLKADMNVTEHGAGNGGDGLELAPPDHGDGVYVPVPGELGQTGTLLVTGTPGAGQTTHLDVAYCKSDSNGQPIKDGCTWHEASSLNQPLTVNPGIYWLVYSQTVARVRVQAGKKTQVELRKLQVGNSGQSNVSFKVFLDFTSPSEQRLILQINANLEDSECGDTPPDPQDVKACNALESGDYHRYLNTVFQFNSDGGWSSWRLGDHIFENQGRDYVTDPQAGQFVSVFPGVYGIEFTETATGQTQDQYGIKVE